MKELTREIINFFKKQHFAIITTIDSQGFPHSSCKGIVKVEKDKICLLDLYRKSTFANLKNNKKVNVTAVEADTFLGYSIKGDADIIEIDKNHLDLLKEWDRKLIERISHRVITHIRKERYTDYHPEAVFPRPQYFISVRVEKVVNLTPRSLRR